MGLFHFMQGFLSSGTLGFHCTENKDLPAIERRTNGSALGPNLKGYFRTKELGSVKLFVNIEYPPFIYLETDDGVTILNLSNEDETKETYEKMLGKIKKP